MVELDLESVDTEYVAVQDEPALELALPQVFVQPALTTVRRGKCSDVDALLTTIAQHHQQHPDEPLGEDYQALVTEFQPFFVWTTACWDYLLSTEGVRFLSRNGEHRVGIRGDYRVATEKDYSRLVHRTFRECLFAYAQHPRTQSFGQWLTEQFWPRLLEAYQQWQYPSDPRQRTLSPYSYLRCVPYQFLNDFHHTLVYSTVKTLPPVEQQAIDSYFFHFYTEQASAETMRYPHEQWLTVLRAGLLKLLINHRLVYCLLRQIERY